MNEEITEYINGAPEVQKNIMELIRSLIHQSVDGVVEEYKWSRPVFKSTKDFAYLQTNKNHVNLGFSRNIDKLNDPNGILEGTGKTMRHVKIRAVSDIDVQLFSQWFVAVSED